jgi:flagellar basal-body rod modification protein FlgD
MTTVTTNTGTNTTSTAAATTAEATKGIGADFNMFLKLLTTQMQNQDPLNPMDTSQYTQQLVQYSQVEQTVQQTGTLKDILTRLTSQDMAQASSYIGKEASFNSTSSALGAKPAEWNWTAGTGAASLSATVTDASGKIVATRTIDPASHGRFTWDGTRNDGSKAAAGSYSLAMQAKDASGGDVTTGVNSLGVVDGVSAAAGVVSVSVAGITYPATQLLGVSAADKD